MSIPALEALRARFLSARISILARPWVASLYSHESFYDELIPYEAPRGWNGLNEKRRLASKLKDWKFDCAILLQNAFEAAALVRRAGIPTRIGYNRDARGWLLTHPIAVPQPGELPRHQRFYYLELLKRANLIDDYATNEPIRFFNARLMAERGRDRFRAASINAAAIGVCPGAAYGGAKRWLPERFADAAVQLASELGAQVVVFGSEEEQQVCEMVRKKVKAAGQSCVNFAGLTSLAEFMEMAAACELFLTNDSGPMHIASALGVPTIAIFGATDDAATGPTGMQVRVVREPVECSPCLLRECPIDHRCMTRVSAEQVTQAALELIRVRSRSGG